MRGKSNEQILISTLLAKKTMRAYHAEIIWHPTKNYIFPPETFIPFTTSHKLSIVSIDTQFERIVPINPILSKLRFKLDGNCDFSL